MEGLEDNREGVDDDREDQADNPSTASLDAD